MDSECILIHNNVTIAADVTFITHDAISNVLMNMDNKYCETNIVCIEIRDNSFIGSGAIIIQMLELKKNTIVDAVGSLVTKGLEITFISHIERIISINEEDLLE